MAIERACTGQKGMQKLQWVQDGSSTIANKSSSTNALTGQRDTQAAQPKQRSLSTTKIEFGSLAMTLEERLMVLNFALDSCLLLLIAGHILISQSAYRILCVLPN